MRARSMNRKIEGLTPILSFRSFGLDRRSGLRR